MVGKTYTPEQIINKLRGTEVHLSQGGNMSLRNTYCDSILILPLTIVALVTTGIIRVYRKLM